MSTCTFLHVGFYDTSEDVLEIQAPRFGRLQKSDVMGVRRDHVEAMERRKDKEKQKEKKETDLPAAIMQMNRYMCNVTNVHVHDEQREYCSSR